MKFSRQGKLIFSTADLVCAAQILNLEKIQETPISTGVTFENITELCINLQLSEFDMNKNDMEVVELRRFVKLNSTWCSPTKRFANLLIESVSRSEKCILCNGPHSATSKICPRHTHEQKILEFKCRNHLTIGEARRLYTHSSKTHYSDAAKINTTAPNIEEIVNQRVESIVQNITTKMEQQTTLLIEIFQKTIENLVQYLVSVFHQTDLKKSPNRKRQMINIVPPTNNPMQWDAGGSNASN
ncbi:uncharacterized protein CEXT_521171 [Caerostris extrusa]|uniref:Uncharacterized protein n=1 Tax=Caerostris extrusa TaxID=172846 RepID=A0AAV4WYU3_CAEEX|nr:uncharacterized protein CEXT_521171 [Caerostris extrusa]